MKWARATIAQLSLSGAKYGANASAVERTGKRSRYVRITDINSDGHLNPLGAVEADLDDESDFRLQYGDLLFARSGNTVGKTYCYSPVDGPCVFAGYLIRFRLNQELINPQYAFYYTHSEEYRRWLSTKKRVAGQPNINGSEYSALTLPLPPLGEQRRIVELLDQANTLRCQRAEADELADRILPSLFRKMFGDPVRNTSEWKTENLLKICSPRQWPTISSRELLPSGFPVYGANGRIGFYSSFNHEKPTVLITCRGATCGTINVCEPNSYVTGNAMALDEPDERKTTNEFLQWFLRVRGLSDTITGAAQPQITRANLAVVEVATPPKDLVDTFTQKAQTVSHLESKLANSRTNIGTLFQTMLHRAFTGELTAGWREAHMKELLAEMELQSKALNNLQVAA
jgi:type I restriction enzyme S subunit